ncbi:hypothetical protein [Frankia sp. CiP3]|uniref:hypothetical protein n=1 Tax=Frankia sp. CiP3 TaxID=2880971 RepID=UPI001EF668B2|nr:hypothetical protein [Frankia sp. CiP3]
MTERMNGQRVKGAAVYAQTNDAARNEVVESDGRLTPVGAFEGVPQTVAGLAVS